jgi:hypothetical protein
MVGWESSIQRNSVVPDRGQPTMKKKDETGEPSLGEVEDSRASVALVEVEVIAEVVKVAQVVATSAQAAASAINLPWRRRWWVDPPNINSRWRA